MASEHTEVGDKMDRDALTDLEGVKEIQRDILVRAAIIEPQDALEITAVGQHLVINGTEWTWCPSYSPDIMIESIRRYSRSRAYLAFKIIIDHDGVWVQTMKTHVAPCRDGLNAWTFAGHLGLGEGKISARFVLQPIAQLLRPWPGTTMLSDGTVELAGRFYKIAYVNEDEKGPHWALSEIDA